MKENNPFRDDVIKILIGLLSVVVAAFVGGDCAFYFLTGGDRLISGMESLKAAAVEEVSVQETEASFAELSETEPLPEAPVVLQEEEPIVLPELSEVTLLRPYGDATLLMTEAGDVVGEDLEPVENALLMPEHPEDGMPDFFLRVNRAQNVVTVYARDENGDYSIPYKAILCSTGKYNRTPLGTFSLSDRHRWRCMLGGVWSQYATRVYKGVMMHSVPYYTRNQGNLEVHQYNRLGEQASAGCIRMNVIDAKWVFEHCVSGTQVEVYDDPDDPGPLGKPEALILDGTGDYPGWDPTDPDYPGNQDIE